MIRLYRALLHLYPASFRLEYADEMCAVFRARARGAGPAARLALLLEAAADVVPNAAAAHWDVLRQDLRYTVRTLGRSRAFTLTAVLVAALGVGANTAAFSVADFVLVRPLPFPRSDRLVKLWQNTPDYARLELSPANLRDWQEMSGAFEGMGGFIPGSANLVGLGDPQRLEGARVTPELLNVLRTRPHLGRVFSDSDSARGDLRTLVLSYGAWQGLFAGDRDIVGRTVTLDGIPHEVVGVMPPEFRFPTRRAQYLAPLFFGEEEYTNRNDNFLQVVGRLRDGVTLEQARADLARVTAELARRYPRELEGNGANVYPMQEELSSQARMLLLALCGAVLCILLLACANLANLLLARAASRERELSVRAALGAGRERLVRQMATESVVLAVAGGVLGVLVAMAAVPLLARLVPDTLPIAAQPSVDLRVLGFAALFTTLTGLGFGVFPALRATGRSGLDALRHGARSGGGRRQRLRFALVVAEVMASVVLLISAGLLVRAVWRLHAVDPGFRTEDVLMVRTALPMPKYAALPPREQFYTRVLSGVRALPGVASAAYVSFAPMTMKGGIWPVSVGAEEVRRGAGNNASLRFATPELFETLGIPVKSGRDIDETDTFDRLLVAFVSESFVRRYFPAVEPLGRRFRFGFDEWTVAGVVGDVRVRGLERSSEPQVYLPYRQVRDSQQVYYAPRDLLIRSTLSPAALVTSVREIVRRADPEQPISDARTMAQVVADETASRRAQLSVLSALAAVALLLAGIGIHGLLSFTVSRRAQEIGVRLALGARGGTIARMILREGLLMTMLGVVPGVVIAYAAGRAMEALLAGVRPADPVTIIVAVVLCLLMTLIGSLLPTRRAVRVDPISVMRTD